MIAFVHIFKTAGTTLTGILRRNFSFRHLDTRVIQDEPAISAAQLKRVQKIYPKIRSIAGHAVRTTSDLRTGFPDIRYYTFIREPRRRLVSAYLFSRSHDIRREGWRPGNAAGIEADFEHYARSVDKDYCRTFATVPRVEAAIEALERDVGFVGLVERFDESLALFRNWLGDPGFDPTYRRLNVAGSQDRERPLDADAARILDDFTRAAREIVASPRVAGRIEEFTAADSLIYDHVVNVIWPRLRKRHGAAHGPFDFERDDAASETLAGRLYRDLIGRPFASRIAGR